MRIDLTPSLITELNQGAGAISGSRTKDASAVQSGAGEDRADLSTGSDAIQDLKLRSSAAPDVRQQRVEALQQSVANGTYRVSPSRVAEAMIADWTNKLA
jgi:flagellar biosynthesis anti-sigma factor FlgM